ncbi:MAG: hypothetical protein V1726_01730 [Methanobacteriota archaeon]
MLDPNPDNYYLWIWINEADLNSGFIHAGNKTLTLIDTTPDFYVLAYFDPSGSEGTLYYSINSNILQMTYDTIIIDGESIYSSTVLIATGTGESNVPAQNQECYIKQYITNPAGQPLRGTTYQPPYYSKGGDKYSRAEWKCTASASWDANHITGRQYNYVEIDSGPHKPGLPPLGRGIAQAWAWVRGPNGGSFSCSQSGTYRIEMSVRLNGATQVSIVNAAWMGSGYASGKNILTGYLYDSGTGYLAGSLERTLFSGSAVPSNWRTWNNEMTTISFNVNLYSGHSYYFKTQLYAEFRAGHVLFGAGYALTGLEAKLLSVTITRL